MGKLIQIHEASEQAPWYFSDAYYSTDARRYIYQWPSKEWPFNCAISEHKLDKPLRPRIRRWIELNLQETVILSTVNNSYRKYYGEKHDWEHSYEISNDWIVLSFENEHSSLAFALAFSDVVSPITKHSPKYPDDEELCKLSPAERYELNNT